MKQQLQVTLLCLSFAGLVFSADAADSQIKSALYDIDRAEQQINRVKRGQTSKLNRIAMMIENAEAQLAASQQTDHESWLDARARLDRLTDLLNNLHEPEPAAPGNELSNADNQLLASLARQTDSLIEQITPFSPRDYVQWQQNIQQRLAGLKQQFGRVHHVESDLASRGSPNASWPWSIMFKLS